MGKYKPLTEWLLRRQGDRVELAFEEIESADKIGVKLPMAARKHQAWWANEVDPKTRHYQCRAWSKAGWKVNAVDLGGELVEFVRARI